jgi:hypothetical protein
MNKRYWLLILLLIVACKTSIKEVDEKPITKYFPDSINADTSIVNLLTELNEPSLYLNNDSSETYRITFIPGVQWVRAKVIRVEKHKSDSTFSIFTKLPNSEINIQKLYDLRSVIKIHPNVNYWDSLQIKINDCDFWNLPMNEPKCGYGIIDGGTYVLEGKMGNKYQLLFRNNPSNQECPKHEELKALIKFTNILTSIGQQEVQLN